MNYDDYFALRGVAPDSGAPGPMPSWLRDVLPQDHDANILDLGCGFGRQLRQIRDADYPNVTGADVSRAAIEHCQGAGLRAKHIANIGEFARGQTGKFAFVLMSHVLEHVPKDETIPALRDIRSMLAPGGAFCVMVPNAQSPIGCYWAYEDFTHQTLFTAGSLLHVLRAAGFTSIRFLDTEGLSDMPPLRRWFKRSLLHLYRTNLLFWNRVTTNPYHAASPKIFTWELKALARL